MAQKATTQKYMHGSESFPILYEDGKIRIYKNPTSEIFVEDKASKTTIRLSSYPHHAGGLQFTTDGLVEPIRTTNTIGWCITRRR